MRRLKTGYRIRDARTCRVDTEWDTKQFDVLYYRALLDKAWEEIEYASGAAGSAGKTPGIKEKPGNSECLAGQSVFLETGTLVKSVSGGDH